MSNLLGFFLLAPLLGALGCLFVPRPSWARRGFAALVMFFLLGGAFFLTQAVLQGGSVVLRWGDWESPFGIVLVGDALSCILVTLSCLTALSCLLFSYFETPLREEHPFRLPLFFFLLVGVHLSFLTGDLFNLFVAFEVLLLASYALMTLEADRKQSALSLPYVLLNLFGSALFLCGCAFAYSLFGTLQFAEIATQSDLLVGDPRLFLLALLLSLVFAVKAGLFPFYAWLPPSYPGMPAALSALYAGLLTKVGVYILMRWVGTVLPPELSLLHTFLLVAAGCTMIAGGLGALAQMRIQSILSYHIISQIGYMVLAIGFFSPFAFTAGLFFVIHQIVVKSSLFLIGGIIWKLQGTDELAKTGGLWKATPWLAVLFVLQALSLAGVPPLSGFWGKWMLVAEGINQEHAWLVAISLLGSVLTLLSMLKIWLGSFWRARPPEAQLAPSRATRGMTGAAWLLGGAALALGLGVAWFFPPIQQAAQGALQRAEYVRAVQRPVELPAARQPVLSSAFQEESQP